MILSIIFHCACARQFVIEAPDDALILIIKGEPGHLKTDFVGNVGKMQAILTAQKQPQPVRAPQPQIVLQPESKKVGLYHGEQILVFSRSGCGNCTFVKQELFKYGIPFSAYSSDKLPSDYPKPGGSSRSLPLVYGLNPTTHVVRHIGDGARVVDQLRAGSSAVVPSVIPAQNVASKKPGDYAFIMDYCPHCQNIKRNPNVQKIDINTAEGKQWRSWYTQQTGHDISGVPTSFTIAPNGQIVGSRAQDVPSSGPMGIQDRFRSWLS